MILPAVLLAALAPAPQDPGDPGDPGDAQWIWGAWADEPDRPAGEECVFRRSFALGGAVERATAHVAVDDVYVLRVNGEEVGRHDDWRTGYGYDVGGLLRPGENVLEVHAKNGGGPAAFLFFADVELAGGAALRIVSDDSWLTARAADAGADEWRPASVIGAHGSGPWGTVSWTPAPAASDFAARFEAPAGFRVEEAWSGLDSLIAIEVDGAGGAFVATEDGGVLRLADADGDGRFESEELFTAEVTYCQGLLWSRDSLFCVGNGPEGTGLYRVDAASPDRPETLGRFDGGMGEHGPHAVVEGPDGALWVVIGNHARLADPEPATSPYRDFHEGHLLERYVDPRGHAVKIAAPGGVVMRAERDGSDWRVMAGGFRNAYDIAFDAHGNLFTFDSDMEWDIGLPWYRAVRLVHVVPGGEYGWRTGSSKWRSWYPDSLPPAAEVGRGSPTGVVCYDGAMFPARYRGAILAGDWSRGRVLAFHPRPVGSSYTAEAEELVVGRPLNVSDLDVAPDGSVLITTGGRGTSGAVLRLVYEGVPGDGQGGGPAAPLPDWPASASLANLVDGLWNGDRFARFVTARELERRGFTTAHLPPGRQPFVQAEALVVAARTGLVRADREDCRRGVELAGTIAATTDGPTRLVALRALELFLLDDDAPEADELRGLGAMLLAVFPSEDREADRELGLLLAHLAPEGTIDALVAHLVPHPSRTEQVHFAYCLRAIESGWSDAARRGFAAWIADARGWTGGFSFGGYVELIARDARRIFGPEHEHLLDAESGAALVEAAAPVAMGVSDWAFDEVQTFLSRRLDDPRRSTDEGSRVYHATCVRCHTFTSDGNAVGGGLGPDLTTLVNRFSRADMLEAILEPSRRISDLYRSVDVITVDDELVAGIPVVDDGVELVLVQSGGARIRLAADEVAERKPSDLSWMPKNLLNGLTLEQVADLFFFLERGAHVEPAGEEVWTPLFGGRTLDGWSTGEGIWSVESREILGRGNDRMLTHALIAPGSHDDFLLELDVRVEHGAAGLYLRARNALGALQGGYRVGLGDEWGSLELHGGRVTLHSTPDDVWVPAVDPAGWNHVVIEARGERLRVEINGVTTSDVRHDGSPSGLIGVQLREEARVRLRNLRIRPL